MTFKGKTSVTCVTTTCDQFLVSGHASYACVCVCVCVGAREDTTVR